MLTQPFRVILTTMAFAPLAAGSTALADECEPHWDLAIGQPGLFGSSGFTSARTMTMFDGGSGSQLHVGGIFTSAGGLLVNRIARWNGEVWWSLAGGANQTVWGMTTYDDGSGAGERLYATGFFTQIGGTAANKIARWDGGFWQPLGAGLGDDDAGIALLGYDDGNGPALYIGGLFSQAGGQVVNGIARWDFATQTYSPLGSGVAPAINAQVNDLVIFDDGSGFGESLFAGGWFTFAGGVPASRVARWDFVSQAWYPLGEGLPGPVLTMALFDDGSGNGEQLYAGGDFTQEGPSGSEGYLARWNPLRKSWEVVETLAHATSGCCPGGQIHSLAVFNDGSGNGSELYVGGFFTSIGGIDAVNFARWDGTPGGWSPVGELTIDAGIVYTLEPAEDENGPILYLGGGFTSISGNTVGRIAAYRGCPGAPAIPGDLNGDGAVNVIDLLILLEAWGPCLNINNCPADLSGDGVVNVIDLLILLANWG